MTTPGQKLFGDLLSFWILTFLDNAADLPGRRCSALCGHHHKQPCCSPGALHTARYWCPGCFLSHFSHSA